VGDANDKALAAHPITSMDPDGEFVATALGTPIKNPPAYLLQVEDVEATWLASYLEAASQP
jgi:hypothetical protein